MNTLLFYDNLSIWSEWNGLNKKTVIIICELYLIWKKKIHIWYHELHGKEVMFSIIISNNLTAFILESTVTLLLSLYSLGRQPSGAS